MSISECHIDLDFVSDLPDKPSMSTAELKATFDGAAKNLREWINTVLVAQLNEALDGKEDSVILNSNIVLTTDSNGNIISSAITASELNQLDGITSNIQTQLNAKQKKITYGTSVPSGGSNGDIYIQYS